jgi:uncharacterized repeat protein (TIGR03803 family)
MTPARHSCPRSSVLPVRPSLGTLLMFVLTLSIMPIALHAQTFMDLHDFNCNTDGCVGNYPGIVAQGTDGNLYGSLPAGGNPNNGTVYDSTPAGTFNKIYNFSGTDGYGPYSGLTLGTDGNFYGATYNDGQNGYGTLFQITPAGKLNTLHNFTATEEGGAYGTPVAGTTGTTFYGITYYSKAYSITTSGTFKLLPNATPGTSYAPLILGSDGNFYGTTPFGGNNGQGCVFRMNSKGAFTVIYSFDYTHGAEPYGPVVQGSDGFLYGTAAFGGAAAHPGGVVFKLSTKGAITVLHNFDNTSTSDGFEPLGGLAAATDGNFYGTTESGASGGPTQYGVLFEINSTGTTYNVLHEFDSTHGQNPETTLVQNTNGILYGETYQGGSGNGGVFYSWNAGIAPFVSLVGYPVGAAGTKVEILGQGLTGTTSVKFGTGSATYTVVNDTYLTAIVPTSGTTGIVTVATPGGTLKSKQTYKVVPAISSFTPTSGPVGTQVTITGSGFTGASKVSFGGVGATFTVNSGTTITATVPSGAVTGKIKVTTKGGTATSSGTFTVT